MVQKSAPQQSQDVVVVQYAALLRSAEDVQGTSEDHSTLEQQIEQVDLRCPSGVLSNTERQ